MRPQDIVILLKIIALTEDIWQLKDLARQLFISPSEISESLNRSYQAGLIDYEKKNVSPQSLMEFLQYGLPYVFLQHPDATVKGIPIAHSHPLHASVF
jgi:predicted transcriptional regulator